MMSSRACSQDLNGPLRDKGTLDVSYSAGLAGQCEIWAGSSVGRAVVLQAICRGFDFRPGPLRCNRTQRFSKKGNPCLSTKVMANIDISILGVT